MNKAFLRIFGFVLFIVVLISMAYHYHLNHYLSVEGFNQYNTLLENYQQKAPILFIIEYMLVYVILISCCMPGTILFDLLAGFLFGIYWGTLLTVVTYLIGAIVNFLIIRYVFKGLFENKFTKFKKLVKGSKPKYLFFNLASLRLIPVIPFWALNIASALVDVSLLTFIASTFLGIIPTSLIYAIIGDGVHQTLARHQNLSPHILTDPKIWLPLIFIAVLMLLPNFIKRR